MNIAVSCFSPDQALLRVEEVLSLARTQFSVVKETEFVTLSKAHGRVLATDAQAGCGRPAYDTSAMDGYAFSFDALDRKRTLRLVGESRAGHPYSYGVASGDCVAIATGAEVPSGCDTVAMLETCERQRSYVAIIGAVQRGANIRKCDEDFETGACILPKGVRLIAPRLALLASAGVGAVPVFRRLRLAVMSVGDELKAVGDNSPCKIADVNRTMLLATGERLGFDVTDLGILPDRRSVIAKTLAGASANHDVVISTAGTSVGKEDHMRGAIVDCGGGIVASCVAIKPGKPVSLGRIGTCLCVALPGNPVAAFTTFLAIGVPLLRHIAAERMEPPVWQYVGAGFDYEKRSGIREFLRVTLHQNDGEIAVARRCVKDCTSMLSAFAESTGLLCLTENVTHVSSGDLVPYRSYAEFLE